MTLSPRTSRSAIVPGTGVIGSRKASTSSVGTPRKATLCNRSPSQVRTTPKTASQIRVAFSSIASKTVARAPGEELMTCNTSAIAVSRASASSRSRRSSARISQGSAAGSSRTALMPSSHIAVELSGKRTSLHPTVPLDRNIAAIREGATLTAVEFADLGVFHPLARLPEIVSHLQPQPGFGAGAEALGQSDRHLHRNTSPLVDEIRQCLPGHPQAFCRLGDRQSQRLEALPAHDAPRVRRIMHGHDVYVPRYQW